MALGQWSIRLRPDTPQNIVDRLNFFSHVAITDGPEDIRVTGDAVLESARYVGVLTGRNGMQVCRHGAILRSPAGKPCARSRKNRGGFALRAGPRAA